MNRKPKKVSAKDFTRFLLKAYDSMPQEIRIKVDADIKAQEEEEVRAWIAAQVPTHGWVGSVGYENDGSVTPNLEIRKRFKPL